MYGVWYLAGISLFCTVAVLIVHHGHYRLKPVPRVLRFAVRDVIGRMLCMNGNRSKVVLQSASDLVAESDSSVVDAKSTSSRRDNAKDDQNANDNSTTTSDAGWSAGTDHQQRIRDEWVETARVVDRFFFVVFFVAVVFLTTALLTTIAVHGPRKVEPISATVASD